MSLQEVQLDRRRSSSSSSSSWKVTVPARSSGIVVLVLTLMKMCRLHLPGRPPPRALSLRLSVILPSQEAFFLFFLVLELQFWLKCDARVHGQKLLHEVMGKELPTKSRRNQRPAIRVACSQVLIGAVFGGQAASYGGFPDR